MNFFQRRKILKRSNFLDLTPVRILTHETRADDLIMLLMPRFKNRVSATLLQPPSKEKHIRIKLDRFGSQAWLLINSWSTVGQISDILKEKYPEDLQPLEETEMRVSKFLALLYQQRYITFREIQDNCEDDFK